MNALDIDPANTYFISDTHFSHAAVMHKTARPFSDVGEMDRFMIECWNAVVPKHAHVWHLGDFGFGTVEHQRKVFNRLNGVKHLIRGNHDKETVASAEFGWASVDMLRVLKTGKLKITLCHYPISEWPDFWHGAIHLHGHTHDNIPSSARRWDAGVDHQGYTPLRLDQIQLRMAELPDLDFRTGTPITAPEPEPSIDADDTGFTV